MPVYQLSEDYVFPPPQLATKEGLLAIGGDLSPKRLLLAYRNGIFPWYSEGEPILWWSPDPRLVLYPDELKVSRSLNKVINRGDFQVTIDRAFEAVITECAQVRLQCGQLPIQIQHRSHRSEATDVARWFDHQPQDRCGQQ